METAIPIQELYDRAIKKLPAAQRLVLAAIILNDIPPQSLVDYSEEWSEEDCQDFDRASWQHITAAVGED